MNEEKLLRSVASSSLAERFGLENRHIRKKNCESTCGKSNFLPVTTRSAKMLYKYVKITQNTKCKISNTKCNLFDAVNEDISVP